MSKEFKGRMVIYGNITGKAVVSHVGVNILASFQKSALKKGSKVICSDQNNKDLYGKDLTNKVLCLPKTIGSTTGGMILQTVCKMGIAPCAMLFSEHIDSIASAGAILSYVWSENKIITIDMLGYDFLNYVKDGMRIEIRDDGIVLVD